MIYRQRPTIADDFLLQVVCPWLLSLHATPLLRLGRIWCEPMPLEGARPTVGRIEQFKGIWGKVTTWSFGNSTHGTYPPVKREQSSVN